MAWSVNNIMEMTKFLTNKNQSASISATRLFYAWNIEQNMYHADIVGRWQKNNNSKEGNNTGLILNETDLTILSPFTLSETITITSPHQLVKPDDFDFRLAMRISGEKVWVINPGQIAEVNNSVIDPPSVANNMYYAIEYEDYYSLLPTSLPTVAITTAELDYVAVPRDIVWGYTLDADKRQVYNPGTSVQPQWKQSVVIEITKRALTNLGVPFKDNDFINAGRMAQATGN